MFFFDDDNSPHAKLAKEKKWAKRYDKKHKTNFANGLDNGDSLESLIKADRLNKRRQQQDDESSSDEEEGESSSDEEGEEIRDDVAAWELEDVKSGTYIDAVQIIAVMGNKKKEFTVKIHLNDFRSNTVTKTMKDLVAFYKKLPPKDKCRLKNKGALAEPPPMLKDPTQSKKVLNRWLFAVFQMMTKKQLSVVARQQFRTLFADAFEGATKDKHTPDAAAPKHAYKKGEKIMANFHEEGTYYGGTITKCRDDGAYDIHYDDGDDETEVDPNLVETPDVGAEMNAAAAAAVAAAEKAEEAEAEPEPTQEGHGQARTEMHIDVLACIGLKSADKFTQNDTYVVLTLTNQESGETIREMKTAIVISNSPMWEDAHFDCDFDKELAAKGGLVLSAQVSQRL
jgi:hypothetical protein